MDDMGGKTPFEISTCTLKHDINSLGLCGSVSTKCSNIVDVSVPLTY